MKTQEKYRPQRILSVGGVEILCPGPGQGRRTLVLARVAYPGPGPGWGGGWGEGGTAREGGGETERNSAGGTLFPLPW